MIRTLIAAGLLAAAGMVSAQEEIARWDFSQGKIDSVDGKFKMRFRGNTKIAGEQGKQYLDIGLTNKDKPEGIVSAKRYPELTPKGAFRLEVKARLREQSTKKPEMALWDNNYVMDASWGRHKTNPDSKKGFALQLIRRKDGNFICAGRFGFTNSLEAAYSKPMTLNEDEDFTLAIEYDGVKEVSFYLNGTLNRKANLKTGGPLTEAVYPLTIGDRYSSMHQRFDGQILEVKLTALPPKTK